MLHNLAVIGSIFVVLVAVWSIAIMAMDMMDEYDRKAEEKKRLWSIDD